MPPPRKSPARAKRAAAVRARPAADGLGVVILSRNPRLYSTRRLVEAALSLGHAPRVLDTLRCDMVVAPDQARIFYRGEEILARDVHVVIPRIGASITGYGLAVVNQFDLMGVPVLSTPSPSPARATSSAPSSSSRASGSTSRARSCAATATRWPRRSRWWAACPASSSSSRGRRAWA